MSSFRTSVKFRAVVVAAAATVSLIAGAVATVDSPSATGHSLSVQTFGHSL